MFQGETFECLGLGYLFYNTELPENIPQQVVGGDIAPVISRK